ncbi:hypothetical protein HMPREF3230_01155 [Gardnerella vaginalis]|uniref:Uncharacterized protein n=1 Tax=Gardnerella vaginalis TaxID=2702 RepID=A0A135Z3U2_GARVA|nr:hypothetical protein HMPREF3230_01155 [Gardnerella vaginalis]
MIIVLQTPVDSVKGLSNKKRVIPPPKKDLNNKQQKGFQREHNV